MQQSKIKNKLKRRGSSMQFTNNIYIKEEFVFLTFLLLLCCVIVVISVIVAIIEDCCSVFFIKCFIAPVILIVLTAAYIGIFGVKYYKDNDSLNVNEIVNITVKELKHE